MARKRTAVVQLDEEEDGSTKIWRANPPGPEQKELNRMFQKGIIGSTDTAAKVRTRNPMFLVYPAKTFALHFRTTKAKYGLNGKQIDCAEIKLFIELMEQIFSCRNDQ